MSRPKSTSGSGGNEISDNVAAQQMGALSSGTSESSAGDGDSAGDNDSAPSTESMTNSEFACLLDRGLIESPTISNWMFERRAFPIACITLPTTADYHLEINGMIEHYNEITEFTWPRAWSTIAALPSADLGVQGMRESLIQSRSLRGPLSPAATDETSTQILSDRFSLLMWDMAQANELQGISGPINDAKFRRVWNDPLCHFYVPALGSVASDLLFKKSLNMCRNLAMDLDMNTLPQASINLANAHYAHCFQASISVATISEPARDQAKDAADAAFISSKVAEFRKITPSKSAEELATRSKLEPTIGICDAIITVPIFGALNKISLASGGGSRGKNFLENLAFVTHSNESRKHPVAEQSMQDSEDRTAQQDEELSDSSVTLVPESPSNPFYTSLTSRDSVSAPQVTRDPRANDLLLPLFIAEYKKDNMTEGQALNQQRTNMVSAVAFFKSIGIVGQPVYGLVTSGHVGAVLMAWYSKDADETFILERNVRTYDISDPWQFLQFAIFLTRLAQRGAGLRSEYEKIRAAFEGTLEGSPPQWTKMAQKQTLAVVDTASG